ncbi:MAG: PAS domain S-box protein [Nitrospirae bacterium]|nr:PAS domain S-box protein [Nitrospirota bacterium]
MRQVLICTGFTFIGALLTSLAVLYYMFGAAEYGQRTKTMQYLNDVVVRLHAGTMGGQAMGAAFLMGLNEPLIKEMAREKLPRDHPETLSRMVAAKRLFDADGVFIVNAAGTIVAHESDVKRSTGMNMSARSYVRQAMADKSSVYPAISLSTDNKVFYIAAPIHEGTTHDTPVIGTLTIRMPADHIILRYLRMLPGQALLVSPEGIVFSSTKSSWMYTATQPNTKEHLEYIRKEKRYGKMFDNRVPEVLPIDITNTTVRFNGNRYAISREAFDWNDLGGLWQLVVIQETSGLVSPLHIALAIMTTIVGYVVIGLLLFVILRQRFLKMQMDEALRKSQQRLALLVQNSPLGIIEWDINFRVVTWNSAAEHIFGYTREEAIGMHATDLIIPEETRAYVDEVWLALIEQKGGASSNNDNITKDGRRITCQWYNVTLIDETGHTMGVASIVDDITQSRKMETDLRQYVQELERFNRLTIGREEKMILLKQEINDLREEIGLAKRYKIVQ